MIRTVSFVPCLMWICVVVLSPSFAPAQALPFSDCGTLAPGVEGGCYLLIADGGGSYLTGLNGFQLGDYVFVEAELDPFCITTCQQGNGCLFNVTNFQLCGDPELFQRGDCNNDGTNNVADPIFALDNLFHGVGGPVACQDACDANDDGQLNIADVVTLLSALFGQTVPLPAPGPGCGADPTPNDLLTCDAANCP